MHSRVNACARSDGPKPAGIGPRPGRGRPRLRSDGSRTAPTRGAAPGQIQPAARRPTGPAGVPPFYGADSSGQTSRGARVSDCTTRSDFSSFSRCVRISRWWAPGQLAVRRRGQLDVMRPIADAHGASVAQVALAWLLAKRTRSPASSSARNGWTSSWTTWARSICPDPRRAGTARLSERDARALPRLDAVARRRPPVRHRARPGGAPEEEEVGPGRVGARLAAGAVRTSRDTPA